MRHEPEVEQSAPNAHPEPVWQARVVAELSRQGLRIDEAEPARFTVARCMGADPEAHTATERRFFHEIQLEVASVILQDATPDERAYAVADLACHRLAARAQDDEQRAAVELVRERITEAAASLRVEHLVKETGAYRARVVHQMRPLKPGTLNPINPSKRRFAMLEFEDKKTVAAGVAHVLDFNWTDELSSAVGSVTVKGDTIAVNPRRGHEFGTPILIPRSSLTRT